MRCMRQPSRTQLQRQSVLPGTKCKNRCNLTRQAYPFYVGFKLLILVYIYIYVTNIRVRFEINPGPIFLRGVAKTTWQHLFVQEVKLFFTHENTVSRKLPGRSRKVSRKSCRKPFLACSLFSQQVGIPEAFFLLFVSGSIRKATSNQKH
jgi:hypothetical protein